LKPFWAILFSLLVAVLPAEGALLAEAASSNCGCCRCCLPARAPQTPAPAAPTASSRAESAERAAPKMDLVLFESASAFQAEPSRPVSLSPSFPAPLFLRHRALLI